MKTIVDAYNEAVFDTDRDRALKIIHDALNSGISPEDIVFKLEEKTAHGGQPVPDADH